MFALAIIIGIYSYTLFALGLIGQLNTTSVSFVTLIFVFLSFIYFKNLLKQLNFNFIKKSKYPILIIIIFLFCFINLIGALGPELSFDALWYHLTLPKIFIAQHSLYFIKNGIFYYSVMPKLIDMLFIPALMFGNEIFAKLIHFSFGILSIFALYKLSRKFLNEKFSLLAVLVFCSSLVFAWESTIAYIDLGRTFFEILALLGFIEWYEKKDRKMLMESGIMLGLAISSKIITLGSLLIYIPLIFYIERKIKISIKCCLIFFISAIIIPLPWFVYSFINTGNPFYPIFSSQFESNLTFASFNPVVIFKEFYILFLKAADPISPIFIIIIPLIIYQFRKFDKKVKILTFYSAMSLAVWYLIPHLGGGRFILPYLPAFSILTSVVVSNLFKKREQNFFIYLIIFICFITIGYRGIANKRYIPVILGRESKHEFLTKNLNYKFGDFYDTDNFFMNNIKKDDKVLLFGFHNLYYANFPFIHESFARKGDRFNYIAIQNGDLPEKFSFWNLIYENSLTNVRVYSQGGVKWSY